MLFISILNLPVLSQKRQTKSPSQKQTQPKINQPQTQAEQIKELEKQIAKVFKDNKKNAPKACEKNAWKGTINLVERFTGEGTFAGMSSVAYSDLSFTGAVPTLNRDIDSTNFDFTDDKGTGTVKAHSEWTIAGKKCECNCAATDKAQLYEVLFHPGDTTYTIYSMAPPCKTMAADCITGEVGESFCGAVVDVDVIEQPVGKTNHDVLSGTLTKVSDMGQGKVTRTITWNLKKTCSPWKDSYSEKRINSLDVKVKDLVSKFIKRVNEELCIQLRVAQGLRTKAEQDELYALGRTKPGKIVTNAKGGQSNHNSGLAIDVYIVKCDATIDLNKRIPQEVVDIAKQEGFEWGGDWKKFKDYPHFEMK